MLDYHFVLVSATLELIAGYTYIRDTLRGKTKPNRVTWFLWGLAPLIAFSAQLSEGVGIQALMTFMVGLVPLSIFFVSFVNRKSYWQLTRFDSICGICSVLALILWRITGNGALAITLSITADFLAGLPTILKMYRNPETESYNLFIIGTIAAAVTLLTVKHWTFTVVGFSIYIVLMDFLLFSLGRFNHQIKAVLR